MEMKDSSWFPVAIDECLLSLAAAVGKPLPLDQVPINKSRPSYARVKVMVDLNKEFPKEECRMSNLPNHKEEENILHKNKDQDPGQCNVVKDSLPFAVYVLLAVKNKFDALIHNEEERIFEEALQVANPVNDNITVHNKEKVMEKPTSTKE
ncbi:hypothetical protein H5410_046750 [Solanum commersonii]|uniref:Uncharacterized protein n=1 Tax=Solanum commersonii TaxID=4109 RepID=A0A9J5XGD5_SOLCO|nr:hypothetical protein H5410_046750 [Solanum commersonii]